LTDVQIEPAQVTDLPAIVALLERSGLPRAELTETAATFFPRFGFQPIPRDQVAPVVAQSIEFMSACPDTAGAMKAEL
jgi:amino-acid N-acetyltransferase